MAALAAEDPYAVLSVPRDADLEEIKEAYFEQAMFHHPDLNSRGRTQAAEDFRRFSLAFWVLGDPRRREVYDSTGHAELDGYSDNAIRRVWLWDFAMEDSAGLDELVAGELQCRTQEDCFARMAEAGAVPTGRSGVEWLGERIRCEFCGFQVRSHSQMRSHFAAAHRTLAETWAAGAQRRAKASFREFMEAASGIEPGNAGFTLPDGSSARFQEPAWTPDVHWSVGAELERACESGADPSASESVASSVAAAPLEAQEAIEKLRRIDPGLVDFLVPSDGVESAAGRATLEALTSQAKRSAGQSKNTLNGSGTGQIRT